MNIALTGALTSFLIIAGGPAGWVALFAAGMWAISSVVYCFWSGLLTGKLLTDSCVKRPVIFVVKGVLKGAARLGKGIYKHIKGNPSSTSVHQTEAFLDDPLELQKVGGVGAAPHSGDPTNSESHTAEQTDECSDHGMVLRCAVAQTLSSQWRSLRHRGGEPTGPAASHCEEEAGGDRKTGDVRTGRWFAESVDWCDVTETLHKDGTETRRTAVRKRGVSITSINRETDLDEFIAEVKKRKEAGMPQLGKASMVDYELCKQRDEAQRQARPHLFFDSQRHVAEMKAKLAADPDFDVMHNPSVSSSDVSTSTIAKSCAGSSTFVDLLKRQYGQV
ncbi:Hypothetical protein SCF082_LOCUS40724 [Durusdinium trenchii]|uniref:Uncharacterized protein n=1 Tax=Durusdinium trenchii TaxID=1381693 RepID=A0ABP0QCT4_9DINO